MGTSMRSPRVLILGIDSAEPLQVEEWIEELPNLKQLYETFYTRVESTVPPITIPAWLTTFSGLNPGYLGLYDLKYREPRTYTNYRLYNYRLVKDIDFIWNRLDRLGLRSILCFVPGTYPPPRINGYVVSGFFTPNTKSNFTHPSRLREEVFQVVGGEDKYIIDIYEFRSIEPKKLLRLLLDKLDHDFKVIKYLVKSGNWNLAIAILMSIDRAQHTLWRFFDRGHPRYTEDPELKEGLLDIYRKIDQELGDLLAVLRDDDVVIVMSDHGAKRMYYRVNVNELLREEGFLRVKEEPSRPISLRDMDMKGLIDWERTTAWAWGAYIAQVWINLKDREKKGIVSREEYEDTCREVAEVLSRVKDPDGRKLDNRVFFKWDVYRGDRVEYMPDITVYFDNLHYGANAALGLPDLYSLATFKGPDDSNHGEYAIFMCNNKPERPPKELEDIADLILNVLNV